MPERYPWKWIASYATRKLTGKVLFDDKDAIPASGGYDESDNDVSHDNRVRDWPEKVNKAIYHQLLAWQYGDKIWWK